MSNAPCRGAPARCPLAPFDPRNRATPYCARDRAMTEPLPQSLPSSVLGLDAKVVLLALVTALLTTGGLFFQKLNEVRAGGVLLSGWLVLSLVCFLPTFFVTNLAFQIGGGVVR